MPLSRSLCAKPVSRRRRPAMESLETRQLLSVSTAENPSYDGLIHAAAVRGQYQVDGSGMAAAVIDTGIDYNHPALGGGYGPGRPVEAGYDFAMRDSDPRAETWSHGTMVSGLLAGRDANSGGVAPGVDLVALRVFGNDNRGDFDLIADALQWVVDHHDEYDITAVNLSISDNQNYARDWWSFDGGIGERIAGLVERLAQLRIPVITAAGNSYRGQEGMGFVAILPGTISVTGTDGDRIWSNAQRLGTERGGAAATDLAAPATGLETTVENGGFGRVEGTSFAAPLVTGAIVLLQQIYRGRFGVLPSVDDVLGWLKRGSDTIRDPSGISIGRLNVEKAAALIPSAAPKPSVPEATLGATMVTTPGSTATGTVAVIVTPNAQAGTSNEPANVAPVNVARHMRRQRLLIGVSRRKEPRGTRVGLPAVRAGGANDGAQANRPKANLTASKGVSTLKTRRTFVLQAAKARA